MSYSGHANTGVNESVNKGQIYTLTKEVTLAAGVTRDFVLLTGTPIVSLLSMSVSTSAVETTVELREDVIHTGGTGVLLMSFNRNRNFKSVPFPIVDARDDPTITNDGVLVETFHIHGVAGERKNDDIFADGEIPVPFVLEPDVGYALRFTNEDNGSQDYRIALYLGHNESI